MVPPIVDLHGDLLFDVTQRRLFRGERHTLATYHLEPLRQAGVKIQVLPIYIEGDCVQETALRRTLLTANAFLEEMDETADSFTVIKTRADLAAALAGDKIGVILAMEGAEALGRDTGLVRLFFELGLRMLGLTWNRANALAEGCGEDTGAGLTTLGRGLVNSLADYPVILDVSHLNEAGFWSALEHSRGPVLASHSNSTAIYRHQRNLTDAQIKALAERGGLIGLNFYPEFVAPPEIGLISGLVRHVEHIAGLVGLEHLALGPDFVDYMADLHQLTSQELANVAANTPAAPPLPSVGILPEFYKALLAAGLSEADTAAVMGGNALRFLGAALPN